MKFAKVAQKLALWAGSPKTFMGAIILIFLWGLSGPIFHFNDTWQLIINTSTTIITFLMVFLIQNTQNRDGLALQTKLDELIRSSDAQDEFMGIEKLTDKELVVLHQKCEAAARQSQATLERALAERRRRGHAGVPEGEREEVADGRNRGMGEP